MGIALLSLSFVASAQDRLQIGDRVAHVAESPHPHAGGSPPGQVAWTETITHPGAVGMWVHFAIFDLVPGDWVVVRDLAGVETEVFTGLGRQDLGTFWSRRIPGEDLVVEIWSQSAAPGFGVAIDEYGAAFTPLSTESICGTNDLEDVICQEFAEPEAYEKSWAVARVTVFADDGTVGTCTGANISCACDFLTSQICIASATEAFNANYEYFADSLTCRRPPPPGCTGEGPPGTIVTGGVLLVSGIDPRDDFALIDLPCLADGAYWLGFYHCVYRRPGCQSSAVPILSILPEITPYLPRVPDEVTGLMVRKQPNPVVGVDLMLEWNAAAPELSQQHVDGALLRFGQRLRVGSAHGLHHRRTGLHVRDARRPHRAGVRGNQRRRCRRRGQGAWMLDAPPDRLVIEQDARPVGDTFASSSVALTLRVTNVGHDDVPIGARLLLNPEMVGCLAGSTGPPLAMRPPDPPVEPYGFMERQWTAPSMREWDMYGTTTPSHQQWMYHVGGSLRGTASLSPPAVRPDLLQYSHGVEPSGDGLAFACFGYELPAVHRPCASEFGGPDNAIAYLWGNTATNAIVLAPGATFEATTHVYAYIDYPITCGVNPPLAVECSGAATSVTLDASASAAIDGSPLHYRWSSLDPTVSFDDPQVQQPVASLPGAGTYQIQLASEVGPYAASCATAVTVSDTLPPDITAPAFLEARTSQENPPRCGARVSLLAAANDLCAGNDVTVTNDRNAGGADATDEYPVGDTQVTFTARDPSDNEDSAMTLVRVIDDTPPAFTSVAAQPSVLWPPNHRMVSVRFQADVADNCDPAPALRVVDVTSSEPAEGLGDGDMSPDFELLPGRGARVMLRAERSGRGRGRTYTVILEAADAAGNTTRTSVQVAVPHDRRRGRR